ncbi:MULTISPECIES: MFS transporter [Streptomyces]|uniref:MFS transporter n=1 Tax=Streptomyces TaxID=1883 RepID=UPI00163BEEF4|nr:MULTISPECIES: MFS transporter [Streptomyces]MBC2875434.1 MFS transporter [Streptomyces sp. TYQ1024]UBI35674.1 MFS transporter [Streptomyces mobaraensis]UKW28268.1 MFS transporter [Streptomyces sp. TYQ1024]
MRDEVRAEVPAEAGEGIRYGWVLAVVVAVQFMVTLDASVVNVALAAMREDLGFTESGLLWVVNAYTLVFGGCLLLGGRIADLYGRRLVLWWGLGLFGLASLAGGIAQSPGQLVAARAVQGLGAAVLAPAALTIVTTCFPEGPSRGRALGWWSAAGSAGGAAGVLIGGVLTEYLDWRWVLLINVPVVVLAAVAGRMIPDGRPGHRSRLDVGGALLATTGLAALVYGVGRTGDHPLSSPLTLGLLGAAVPLLAGFVLYEARAARSPLVRLGLFARRTVSGANVTMLLLAAGQFASFYFVSLYLQRVLDYSPAVAGLAFIPFCLGFVTSAMLVGRVYARTGPRVPAAAGALVGALGLFWFSRVSADGGFLTDVLGPSLVTSLGIGACVVPLAHAATTGVPPTDAGMASGILNSAQQVGGSLGLAVTVSVATSRTTTLTDRGGAPLVALNDGYGLALLAGAGLLAVAALLTAVLPGRPRRDAGTVAGPDEVEPAPTSVS